MGGCRTGHLRESARSIHVSTLCRVRGVWRNVHSSDRRACRAGRLSRRGSRILRSRAARGHEAQAAPQAAHRARRVRRLAATTGSSRLADRPLAEGARRPRLGPTAVRGVQRGAGPGRRTADLPLRRHDGRTGHLHLRQRRAEAALSSRHHRPPHLVVPGILRARSRIGSREPSNPCGPRRRPLRRQRAEDLDILRALGGQDFLPGAHRSERQEATGESRSCSSTWTRRG